MEYEEKSLKDKLIESIKKSPKTTIDLAKEFNVSRDLIYHTLQPLAGRDLTTKTVYPKGGGHKQILWIYC